MTSLGGPRKAGTALGAPAKKAAETTTSTDANSNNNSTTNSESNASNTTSTTTTNGGTGLGGPPKTGTGLGGPKTGTGLGGPPKTGTGLGGPAKTGTGLGGPKTGTGLGGPPKKTESPKTEEKSETKSEEVKVESKPDEPKKDEQVTSPEPTTTQDNKKNQTKQKGPALKKEESAPKKTAKKEEPAPKKGGPGAAARKALAEKIKKQQEEEEKLRKEQEELERLEEEKRKKEEEEAKIKKEKEEIRNARSKEQDKIRKKEQAEKKKEQQRLEALKRYGVDPNAVAAIKSAQASAPKKQDKPYQKKPKKTPEEKEQAAREAAEKLKQEEAAKAEAEAKLKAEAETDDAVDDWEKLLEEDDKKAEEEKKQEEERKAAEESRIAEEKAAAEAKEAEAQQEQPAETQPVVKKEKSLRSPICCILGHVDTGKTSLLDRIRKTNVQGGEAGGITQQIGATYIPKETLLEQTNAIKDSFKLKYKIPGLLVIDTPGHEIFTNLRSRGSSLCDIAVLVVDLMHSIEQQTRESIELLKRRKTPFIVAMNKIDRCYNWVVKKEAGFVDTYENQSGATKADFEERTRKVIADFAISGLNAQLYTRNPDMSQYVSLVPTSAVTGEGIPDLLGLIVKLTETKIAKRITEMDDNTFTATVLEVKSVEGHGFTIDIILSNGEIRKGDRIVLCGKDKAIDTKIRALMTPQPLREMRVKTPYLSMNSVRAAAGIKIAAQGLENAIAGSELFVIPAKAEESYVEEIKERVQQEYNEMITNLSFPGVSVQASTLGSLEAVLAYMQQENIPVAAINIGRIHKSDVIRAAVNLEPGKAKEYGCILGFDVDVEKNAQQEADRLGVKIWCKDIIYHLFDEWTKYQKELIAATMGSYESKLVYPVEMEILPEWILAKRNPILLGVKIVAGWAKMNTQVCVIKKNEKGQPVVKVIGRIVSIEADNEPLVDGARVGKEVAVKIMGEPEVTFGRHFDEKDHIYSVLTRDSIDALVTNCRDLLRAEPEIVKLVKYLKDALGIDKFGTTLADEKKNRQ
eukprot:TRINITY_DN88_c0_g1_i1.p1 TRINITY_DN88_c0_g1~~TRINITY_DN88_c0_g1_i1.p1  ORF type:complete len:1028 (-),score=432.17 TRINITY_DN88_c0_g1_i1:60-3143(-)